MKRNQKLWYLGYPVAAILAAAAVWGGVPEAVRLALGIAAAALVGVCHTSLLHEKMLRTDPDYRVAVLDERNLALKEKAGNIANAANLTLMGIAAVVFLGLGYTVPALVLWGLIAVNPLILIGISSLLEKRMLGAAKIFSSNPPQPLTKWRKYSIIYGAACPSRE